MGDVVELDTAYYGELPAAKVLDAAKDQNLETAMVIGFDQSGKLVTSSTTADCGMMLLLLELAKASVVSYALDASEMQAN